MAMAPQGQAEHEQDHEHGHPNSSRTDPGTAATPTSSISSGFGNYARHVAIILAALLTALALAVALDAAVRYLVGRRRGARLASAAAECAICLTEFADGDDAVRVMPACRHVFHASCIELWLAEGRQSSCPTCRAPAAAAAAAQADEATNRQEPYSGTVEYAQLVGVVFLIALMTALGLPFIVAAVLNMLGRYPARP